MKLALAIVLAAFTAGAAADTANLRRAKSTLEFWPAGSASGGASAPREPASTSREALADRDPVKDEQFRKLDIDGDGRVSKAEAAGNAFATLGFDRADRNRDGKLTFAEYDSIGKPRPQKKGSKQAKAGGSASAGGTKAKN